MYTMNTYYRLFDIIVKRYKQCLKSVHSKLDNVFVLQTMDIVPSKIQ